MTGNRILRRFLRHGWPLALLIAGCQSRNIAPADHAVSVASRIHGAATIFSVSDNLQLVLEMRRCAKGVELSVVNKDTATTVASAIREHIPVNCSWSPDSNSLLLLESRGNEYVPAVWHFTKKDPIMLLQATTRASWMPPVWLPDGNSFVFLACGSHQARLERRSLEGTLLSALADVNPRSDISVSGDGGCVAGVDPNDTGRVVIAPTVPVSHKTRSIRVMRPGRIRSISWAPRNDKLLVAARARDDEYAKLYLVESESGRVTVLQESNDADVGHARWIGHTDSYAFQLSSQGRSKLLLGRLGTTDTQCLIVGPGEHRPVRATSDGRSILFRYDGTTSPVCFLTASVGVRVPRMIACDASTNPSAIAPTDVHLTASDGFRSHGFLWKSPATDSDKSKALIVVHGGPALCETPRLDPRTQVLLHNGCHVLSINYRGSTGFGRQYEAHSSAIDEARDVVAGCEFLLDNLGVPPSRVVLLGISHGAAVAAQSAILLNGRLRALVMISPASLRQFPDSLPGNYPVIALLGQEDDANPRGSVSFLRRVSGSGWFGNRFASAILPGDGHNFQRLNALTLSDAVLLDLLSNGTP